MTNPDLTAVRETEIVLRGASVKEIKVTTLVGNEMRAHNSFENPRAVEPKERRATLRGDGVLICAFAPASVTRLQLTLA